MYWILGFFGKPFAFSGACCGILANFNRAAQDLGMVGQALRAKQAIFRDNSGEELAQWHSTPSEGRRASSSHWVEGFLQSSHRQLSTVSFCSSQSRHRDKHTHALPITTCLFYKPGEVPLDKRFCEWE